MEVEMTAKELADKVRLYSVLVGVLLILVFVVPCVVFALVAKCFQKQTNNRKSTLRTMMSGSIRMTENFGTVLGTSSRDNMLDSTASNYGVFGQIEFPVDRIKLKEVMVSVKSSLACLEVWKGYAPAMLYSGHDDKIVAIKKLNPNAHVSRHQALQSGRGEAVSHANCLKTELCSYSNLMPHPHLLNLLGVTTSGGNPTSLILECPLYGSMHTFLICKRRGHISDNTSKWAGLSKEGEESELLVAVVEDGVDGRPASALLEDPLIARRPFEMPLNERFTEEDELLFALQIASAMESLVNCGILHKRLSSENIFISGGFKLKISGIDFENPVAHRSNTINMLKRTASGRNLLKWDAPEVIEGRDYSEKSEVWRFAMTLWEISSLGDTPFAEIPNRALTELLKKSTVPHQPEGCSSELYTLMMRCWATQSYRRPSFTEITSSIKEMLEPPRHKTTPRTQLPPCTSHHPPRPHTSTTPQCVKCSNTPQNLPSSTRLLVTPPLPETTPTTLPSSSHPHNPRHVVRNLHQRMRRPTPANAGSLSFCSPLAPSSSPDQWPMSPEGYNETAV